MPNAKRKLILILGMHRSGTSVLTHMIHRLGVPLGVTLKGAADNPDGYFENENLVIVQESLLQTIGRTWHSTEPMPDAWWETDLASEALGIMTMLVTYEFQNTDVFAFKDPRTCLLLPLWARLIETLDLDARYVVMTRNPHEVAASLAARDGFAQEKSLALWQLHMNAIHAHLALVSQTRADQGQTAWDEATIIDYHTLLDDPLRALHKLSVALALPPASEEQLRSAASIVKRDMRHHTIAK
ncbi:sulfotransferase family protein [Ferroacidibacillus organovorans]|uniref:Sulfotransferase family protein n=1 Tax=Ferroacidibacillus organovorans TaxID=1765683 RepID=A0A1V4EVJ0_9BACL|nr:sulfotransferase [Ferroacidibacillus organovorans]OPG16939.1 hypothetical protein B2M26_04250 [Ferroacidibacillus organovorans]